MRSSLICFPQSHEASLSDKKYLLFVALVPLWEKNYLKLRGTMNVLKLRYNRNLCFELERCEWRTLHLFPTKPRSQS